LRELDKFTKIAKYVYSTGGFKSDTGSNIEQSLAIDTEAGLVVVCGCAHPGIINVLERVMASLPNRKLHLIMGGFHLQATTAEHREQILRRFLELGVEMVSPCSCSGGRFRESAKQEFEENYIECGVGLIIRI
jgi:7,8-dihydropterin-6-yl-methyl-4-(beta-D-ribofuranosyl)aminobenzene 5'-phosphate synthase